MSHSLGLLVGSRTIPRWVVDAISRVEQNGLGEVTEVLVPNNQEPASPEKGVHFYLNDIRQKGCWAPVAIGGSLLRQLCGPLPALERVPVTSISSVDETKICRFTLRQPSTYRYTLSTDAVQKLAETDITLHWGIGILTGEVLSAPKHGIWGVHQGDIRKYRGGPPGFWEYVNGEETAGVTLQQYTEELDGGAIVAERSVNLSNVHTWPAVRQRLCIESEKLFIDGIRQIDAAAENFEKPNKLGPVYRPGDRDCITSIKYVYRTFLGRMAYLSERVQR